jgi:lambda family phage minor tail protein L
MTVPQKITEELQKVAPSAIIELFELRLVEKLHGSADIYRFHAGVNGKNDGGNVLFGGQTFTVFPIECDGFEYSGNGQLPRPRLRVANVMSTITTVLLAVNAITPGNDLIGAKVVRRRTLARYMDAANFPGNVNPFGAPDSTAEFPEEIYYISRKVAESRDVVEFELAAAFDLQGVRAPKRQCIANVCQWGYRSVECGYSGPPVANEFDVAVTPDTSAEATAYYSAAATLATRTAQLTTATSNLNATKNTLNAAQGTWKLEATRYDNNNLIIYFAFSGGQIAKWDGANVSIGTQYRLGNLRSQGGNYLFSYSYEIQRWFFDTSQVSSAQTAYNSALAAYNTALSNYNAALSARNTALTTWQASASWNSDIAFSGDACGKRVSSCKLRFGADAPLPFGSFPAVGSFTL